MSRKRGPVAKALLFTFLKSEQDKKKIFKRQNKEWCRFRTLNLGKNNHIYSSSDTIH